MLHLMPDVVLHALLLIDLLLLLHVEEDPRRHRDGDGVLWLWLEDQSKGKRGVATFLHMVNQDAEQIKGECLGNTAGLQLLLLMKDY